jgi:peptide/nickel transport system substrate-binding protein
MITTSRLFRPVLAVGLVSAVGLGLPAGAATKAKTTKKSATKTTAAPATIAAPATTVTTTAVAKPSGIKTGGTLTYLQTSEAAGFSPAVAGFNANVNGNRLMLVYDALFWAPTSDGTYSPRIGQSITTGDGVTWTLKLRPSVKFSDGTPFDAAAVKANIEFHANVANRSVLRTQADQVDSMTTPDPLTLVMVLKARNTQFDALLARQMTFIFSPKAMQEKGPDKFNNDPVGAGPFMLKEWSRDNQQVFVRNPNYWDAPKPYLDSIIIRVLTDHPQRVDTFKSGKGDLWYGSDPSQAGSLLDDKALTAKIQGLQGGTGMILNGARAPFDDVRMRQAVQLAFNRDDFNKVLYNGKAAVVDTFLTKSSPLFDPAQVQPCCDLAKAQKLVDSYVAEKTAGRPVTFTITYPAALRNEGEYLQQLFNTQLKNVTAQLEIVDTPTLTARVNTAATRNYQMGQGSQNFLEPELEFYGQFRGGSSLNVFGFNDPQMNSVLDKLRENKVAAARKAQFGAAVQILFDQAVMVYTRRQTLFHIFDPSKVKGYEAWSDNLVDWAVLWKA